MTPGWPWDADTAAWIGSISTFLAMIFAGVAAYKTFQALELERKRDRDNEEDRKRAQASHVAHHRKLLPGDESTWERRGSIPSNGVPRLLRDKDLLDVDWESLRDRLTRVYVRNGSTLPVYDVTFTKNVRWEEPFNVAPRPGGGRRLMRGRLRLVLPGEEVEILLEFPEFNYYKPKPSSFLTKDQVGPFDEPDDERIFDRILGHNDLSMRFRDAAGRR